MTDVEFCCERLELYTVERSDSWAPRMAEINADGSIKLLRGLPEPGQRGLITTQMDFSYCPFCGELVNQNTDSEP